jgi:hypothetical protein
MLVAISVVILIVIVLNVITLSAIMLSVIILIAVAPDQLLLATTSFGRLLKAFLPF